MGASPWPYGLTEVTTAATANPVFGVRKPGSVGLPLPDLELKIFDEQDNELSVGRVGEIVVRPQKPFIMFSGY